MKTVIMALDAGTTSCRCILFDRQGNVRGMAQKELTQYYPEPGWVEQDAGEIWETQFAVCREAMRRAGAEADDIAALGITNQRETTILWDKTTGKPVCRAIVWQCRRTADYCDSLRQKGLTEPIRKKTGLVIDAYFSASKIRWILEHIPGTREKAEAGELLFGTVDSFLIWHLTGGKVHAIDRSNASRTMLYNIHTLCWDDELLREFDIPASLLPEVKPSCGLFGMTDPALFGKSIPITGAAGDQQCALFGQTCFDRGDAKNTYGTGAFLLMNTGKTPVFSENGLVTTVAWGIGDETEYALEGSVFVAGAAIQWLRNELKLIGSASDSEYFASKVEDTAGCYVVPAFTGLGAPYWNPYARGTIVGLTRGVGKEHLIRATLESVAFGVNDILAIMQKDCGIASGSLYVDGGASKNDLLMQMQADISGLRIQRPTCVETTALGAAYFAGLAVGFWKDKAEIRQNHGIDRVFSPVLSDTEREKKLKGWKKAVRCALFYANDKEL